MDLFYQKKFTSRIIAILFLLNLSLMGLLVWKKVKQNEPYLFPKNEAFKDVSGILKKELELNDAQIIAFERIRTDYYQKEIVVKQHIKDSKDAMNEEMFNRITDDSKIQRLACSISEDEYTMELIRYQQAKELKAICTKEQLEKFETLVKEIRDYCRPDNQPTKK